MKRNGYIIKKHGSLKAYTDTNDGGCVAKMHIDKWEVTEKTISECEGLVDGLYKVVWEIFKGKYNLKKITKIDKAKELANLEKKDNKASFRSSMGGLKSQDAVQRIVTSNQERKIKRAEKYIRILKEDYKVMKASMVLEMLGERE